MTDQLLDHRSVTPGEEPPCEVLVDDTWHPGWVRAWFRREDGWHANVEYSATARTREGVEYPSNHLATFAPGQYRKVEDPDQVPITPAATR
jgi:hypothetical protein